MKQHIGILFLIIFFSQTLFSDAQLSGEAGVCLDTFPAFEYSEDHFDSLLNPGNYQDLHDFTLDADLLIKLSCDDEKTDLNLWLTVKPYNIAQGLLAASTESPEQTAAVNQTLAWLGDQIYSFGILRANIGWYLSDFLIFRIGRQSMLTGYGYGWNPMDFINPIKNPLNPEQELKGIDALTIQFYLGNSLTIKMAGIYRPDVFEYGIDYSGLQAGFEITGYLPSIEAKLCGFYDYDETDAEDAYVPALGGGLKIDLAGAGIYGEGTLFWGSRSAFPDTDNPFTCSMKIDQLFSALLGLEYTFSSDLSATIEYFYNGEGYDLIDRELYSMNLELAGFPGSNYMLMYRPGYFAEHYMLLNLYLPLYSLNMDIQLPFIYSPDSWAFSFMPMIIINASGSMTIELGYMGFYSLKDDQFNEAWLSPFKHVLRLKARYSF